MYGYATTKSYREIIQPHINRIQINDKSFNIPTTPIIQNVQPSSLIKKTFPPLPFTEENQKFIKKFNFQFSDLSDTEYVKLCTILVNKNNVMLNIKMMSD